MARLDNFLRWIQRCNSTDYQKSLLPFLCQQQKVGYIKPSFAEHLSRYPKVFTVSQESVSVHSSLQTPQERTSAAAEVLADLRDAGVISGWRDELYPVTDSFYKEPCMLIERAAAVPFGIRSYGVHMNGYVLAQDGSLKLWVARRARTKQTWPGKLDHLCAGGQPHGIDPTPNMIKEAAEEASISEDIARHCKAAGAVSYAQLQDLGLKRDCLFVYDLQLPEDFQPQPADGEVESFELMDIEKVAEVIGDTTEFKDNCNLVILDFMVRKGVFAPESPGYLDLVSGLRQQDCS